MISSDQGLVYESNRNIALAVAAGILVILGGSLGLMRFVPGAPFLTNVMDLSTMPGSSDIMGGFG